MDNESPTTSVIVCGGGVVGLATALMLSRGGHTVTVCERDPSAPPADPADAWLSWERRGVAQFRQPHNLLPRFRQVLAQELPDVLDRLVAAGCHQDSALLPLPPSVAGYVPDPDDDRFRFVTGRRPVVEAVFAAAAEDADIRIHRGTAIAGLLAGASLLPGIPHVAGVRTVDGAEFRADLVVDATGRRTPSAHWLAGIGAAGPETESEDGGFAYYTRYFTGPRLPRRRSAPFTPYGTFALLTIPGDNDTWSITVVTGTGDAPLKALRDPEAFTRVVGACPLQAHWLDGTPITDVVAMAGVLDCRRRFVSAGRPVATGFAAVGDAWACTNPTAARGLSIGLLHARLLRDVVREHADDPAGFPLAWDEATERVVAPFYREQIAADRARAAEMAPDRIGEPAPGPTPFTAAAFRDAEVFRGLLETATCLALTRDVLARPVIRARIADAPPAPPASPSPMGPPGPDREQLLCLLAG
ncbi:NAD(P)/FAD-dependent oxidoreductase [Embleya sp. NPDC059259]|uniref:NAD(P)/FAD-dependent oxidoreductase n=1 Tax=unclassified Embleya TaxID=2699296 RepID=UPI00368A71FA